MLIPDTFSAGLIEGDPTSRMITSVLFASCVKEPLITSGELMLSTWPGGRRMSVSMSQYPFTHNALGVGEGAGQLSRECKQRLAHAS